MLAGNGGSAADAQHIAAEFVGRFVNDRAPLAAIALTTDTSALTAIGNDYGFEQVFERQVRALGRKGDVFIAHLDLGPLAERDRGAQGGARTRHRHRRLHQGLRRPPMHPLCDLVLASPSDETALIQQIHITAAHAICHLVERELFGAGRS